MKTLKTLIAALILLGTTSANAETNGLHLFFNETEYVDVMTLERSNGKITGTMQVPNDFDGTLDNVTIQGLEISFDLFVPKNSARPQDLVFHYKGKFFDSSLKQLTGYVTIKDQPGFVASFVAFLRD